MKFASGYQSPITLFCHSHENGNLQPNFTISEIPASAGMTLFYWDILH
ncbi:MAG: hypothetical protein M9958_04335 [Chitinophagales bacterium]|nr:hypothetical protein [Chitinophagales bacterium]